MEQKEFEHNAERVRQRLLEVVRSQGLSSSEADDVAQDTMLKLWALRELLDDGSMMTGMGVRIARRLAIDFLRRQNTVPIEGKTFAASPNSMPDRRLEDADEEEWLQKRLARLPQTEYEILRLRQVEGRSNSEIAAILGIGKDSVVTLLSRARHKLMNDIKRRKE